MTARAELNDEEHELRKDPCAEEESTSAARRDEEPELRSVRGTPPRPTVLVVDDSDLARALVRAALEDEELQVLLAADGTEALAAVRAQLPDCIVLDVCLPESDGFAVFARLREVLGARLPPVVFLTGLHDKAVRAHALALSPRPMLTKPVDPAVLVEHVLRALGRRPSSAP